MLNGLERLVADLNLVLQKSKVVDHESYLRGEKFNIFHVCGVDHYETIHSSILAEFLNPKGSHGQGVKYLNLFLKMLREKGLAFAFSETDVSVYTEYPTDNGRLDILLKNAESQIIIVENKIYAQEQDMQLNRYSKWAKSNSKGKKDYAIVYLTLDGKESNTTNDSYIRISYSEDILNWMQDCAKESFELPLVRETIRQYINHLNLLTNKTTMDDINKEEFLRIMLKNDEVVSEIMKRKNDFVDAAVREHLLPDLEKVAETFDLEMSNTDGFLSKKQEKDIVFRKKDWSRFEIRFGAEKANWYVLYVGVAKHDSDSSERIEKLNCMSDFNNGLWCGGWKYLNISHIDADTVPVIISRDSKTPSALVQEISGIIRSITDEIKERQIEF